MTARTIVGIIVAILGILGLGYAVINFNTLFFESKLLSRNDVPLYATRVALPFLTSVLIFLDGTIVIGLKRWFSLLPHFLANVVWVYATATIYSNLSVPVAELSAYQLPFFVFFGAVVLFLIGTLTNEISKKHAQAPTYR